MSRPYADSAEHLADELRRLDIMLRRALVIARPAADGETEYRGLVISEADIDHVLESDAFLEDRWQRQAQCAHKLRPLDERLDRLRAEIDARIRDSLDAGAPLALARVKERFQLSAAEMDVLLIACAPELEPRYELLYSYLQNDVTRRRPSIDLALDLISRSGREKLYGRRFFAPGAALIRHRLVELGEEAYDRKPTLLRRFLQIQESLTGYLAGQPVELGANFGRMSSAQEWLARKEVNEATEARLERLAEALARAGEALTVHLAGVSESALRYAAAMLCHLLHKQIVFVDVTRLEVGEDVAWLERDLILGDGAAAITGFGTADRESGDRRRQTEDALLRALSTIRAPLIFLGSNTADLRPPPGRALWHAAVEPMDFAERHWVWQDALNGTASTVDMTRLADTFHFGSERIHQAVQLASGLASVRETQAPYPRMGDLLEACRLLTTPNLERLAIRIEPRFTWRDLVLPGEKVEQLRAVAARMRHRQLVHDGWGFGEKLSRGGGINLLFAGPSGTGKTMAAEVLAGDLGLDLYQIDLASVVSKYIGETEKQLSAIFREAESSQTLLFFDEADALFGKRTEVKDAHDRYANIEVNYLLQRIEQYQGVVVLATNFQKNVDDAFLRRMHDVVEFPFPGEDMRERIWRCHLPSGAPCAGDIDFSFLAKQFKLAGGNIRNIVVNAAFRAASAGEPVSMRHLVLSTRSELLKMGKLCVKSDFDRYYAMTQQG